MPVSTECAAALLSLRYPSYYYYYYIIIIIIFVTIDIEKIMEMVKIMVIFINNSKAEQIIIIDQVRGNP